MKIEEKIKFIREQEKLSQEKFAARLGVTRQTVLNWEKGKSTPESALLLEIAREFHMDPTSLLNDDQIPSPLITEKKDSSLIEPIRKNRVVPPLERPLYVCKKTIFNINLAARVVYFTTFLVIGGGMIWVSSLIDKFIIELIFMLVGILFLLSCVYMFINLILEILTLKTTNISFYSDCIILKKGILKRNYKYNSIHIEELYNLQVNQTLLGKLLDYGTIQIQANPQSIHLHSIKRLRRLKKFILKTYPCKEDFTAM